MPSTTTISPTGDIYIDGVLSGTKWAVNSFTYSFPTDPSYYTGIWGTPYGAGEENSGFKAFNATQQAAVTSILGMYSAVANVTFTQITETSTQHADIRYAESSLPGTAWTYYPSTSPEGGDAWFRSNAWYDNPVLGNYAWLTILHETGHAMGLKHPHETVGSFGAIPVSQDSEEYSVMSYRSYIGASTTGGLTNATWSFSQTLMMDDIAALQTMYGANYNTNSGNTVYQWDPNTGQEFIDGVAQIKPGGNTIFMTVWDGGGNDTYDFSNYHTNVTVNLQPGQWSTPSTAQLANLGGGHTAIGSIANSYLFQNNTASLIENAVGGTGNDTLVGNTADNHLTGGAGNDTLDGVSGTDTAVYSGNSTDYRITANADGSWTVTDLRSGSPDGTDTLKNIDLLQFNDKTMAIGTTPPPPALAAPNIVAFSPDTASVGDGITKSNLITLTGTADAGSTIKVYDGSTLLGSAVAGANGAWSFGTSALTDGTHSFTATATDSSGNTSAASSAMNVIVDTVAPVDPTVSLQSIDSNIAGDHITNVNEISLTGVAEINSTIKVYDNGALLGSATADAAGVWNFVPNVEDDQAAAPATPVEITGSIPSGRNVNPGGTNASIQGAGAGHSVTGNALETVNSEVGGGHAVVQNIVATTTPAANGADQSQLTGEASAPTNQTQAWAFTTGALSDGLHNFTVVSTDAAGNDSSPKNFSVTIDTTPPTAPSITSFSNDSGVAGDHVTNDNTLSLTGTAEAGATVKVYDGATLAGQRHGQWQRRLELHHGHAG